MEQRHDSMRIAGIDIGKHTLDAAVHGLEDGVSVTNDAAGVSALIVWLKQREVGRVGIEATGGYERRLREGLEAAGLAVVVHQPIEVRLFARLKRLKAKNDRLDARLIAAATVQIEAVRAARDPRLTALSEHLTAYEPITEKAADLKTHIASVGRRKLLATLRAALAGLERAKAKLLAGIIAQLERDTDLAERHRLLLSLPGVGPVVAATLAIRMPELGSLDRGQAASLAGVAPFDRDSGQWRGQRFIQGGRERPRRMLYPAALQAKRCSPDPKAFAEALVARGKPKKVAIVAVMRKLIEAANLVLKRQTPWLSNYAH